MSQRKAYYNRILQEKPIYKKVLDALEEEDREIPFNLVFMPVLIEFVSWVLAEAVRSGKKRLYFLARDGYQMYLVAQKLCILENLSIECRYLNVSRFSMRVPEYHLLKENCVDHICVAGIDVTVGRILKRAGLEEFMAQIFLPEYEPERILNYNQVMEIKEKLRHNQMFLEQVYKISQEAYGSAMGYLRQEGLMDDIKYALVDSGWVGTLQRTIARLVDKPDLEGYYFGLYETPKDVAHDRYHGYYFSARNGIKRKVNFSNCLFEAIFTSPEGMTVGYENKEGPYLPVTDFAKNPNAVQIAVNCINLENYMEAYMHLHRASDEIDKTNHKESVSFVEKLLNTAMGNPTDWEVQCYGDLLFSDDVLEGNLKKVAAELTTEEIRTQRFVNKALIMLGIKKEEIHESAWIEGSIRRNGVQVRKSLFHAKLYKYFVYLRKLMK